MNPQENKRKKKKNKKEKKQCRVLLKSLHGSKNPFKRSPTMAQASMPKPSNGWTTKEHKEQKSKKWSYVHTIQENESRGTKYDQNHMLWE